MRERLTFTAHFVLCLACAALTFFAWVNGVPQLIFASDLSMMTSVIGALFVGTALYLGWQAWDVQGPLLITFRDGTKKYGEGGSSAEFGHLAALLFPALGMLGTIIGLSMQFKSLAVAANPFEALRTALFSTGCGIAAMIVTMVMVHSLEAGIKRARR